MLTHLEIQQNELLQHPLMWFECNNKNEDSSHGIENKLKEIIGYKYGNSHIRWSNIFGDEFAFHVYLQPNKKNWSFTVWDYKGNTSLGTNYQPVIDSDTDIMSKDVYDWFKKITENYTHNIVSCSACNKQINKADIAGRYFAGIYCKHCWETKYKAIEAKETYE
jgi:hypothetical protein